MIEKVKKTTFGVLVKYLIYFILVYALCSTIICLSGYDLYNRGYKYQAFVVAAVLLLGSGAVGLSRILERWHGKQVIITGLALANLLMAYFLVSFWTVPVSDYSNVFQIAIKMADGTYDIVHEKPYGYGYLYNWQTGMAFLESLIFKVIKPSSVPLKLLNVILINLTLILTYITVKTLGGKRRASFVFLLMSLFYPMIVSVGQISNQNVVAPLILWLILLIERNRFFAAGIMVAIINFIRPLGIILIIAVGVLLVVRLLSRQQGWKVILRQAVWFATPWIAVTVILNAAMLCLGYAEGPMSSPTLPYFKFYQGLYIEEWNNPAEKIESLGGDVEKYNEWTRDQVQEAYTRRPLETIANNFRKMTMLLGMYDWKFAYSYNQDFPEFTSPAIVFGVTIGWAEYILLLLLCLLGFGAYHKAHSLDFVQILFIGMVCVYFFVEAWPDYRYDFYSLMFIIASYAYPLRVKREEAAKGPQRAPMQSPQEVGGEIP